MRKPLVGLLAFITSAPCLVGLGMTVLIMGGLAGSSLLETKLQSPSLTSSGLIQDISDKQPQGQTLVREIQSLKDDANTLIANDGYGLLGIENRPSLKHGHDPFALIAPPTFSAQATTTETLLGYKQIRTSAKIVIPAEMPQAKISGSHHFRRIKPATDLSLNVDLLKPHLAS